MNRKRALYTVPVASTEFTSEAKWDGTSSSIRYAYKKEGVVREAGIRFKIPTSFRQRAERACTAWHIEVAYDTLVEVEDSTWAREIYEDTDENWRGRYKMRHFMIYLDSVGCFEVIADSWEAF